VSSADAPDEQSVRTAILGVFSEIVTDWLRFIEPIGGVLMQIEAWDDVYRWLGAAAKRSSYDVALVVVEPLWEPLRRHPRYPEFHRTLNLPKSV